MLDEDGYHSFELRSVSLLRVQDHFSQYVQAKPNRFDSIRFMRHGGHRNWWKQERMDKIVTQCVGNVLDQITSLSDEDDSFFPLVHWCMSECNLSMLMNGGSRLLRVMAERFLSSASEIVSR